MSEEEEELLNLLEKLKLGKYLNNFQNEEVLHSDLEDMSEEELAEVIPKKIHRRRLWKYLKSPVKENEKKKVREPKVDVDSDSDSADGEAGGKKVKAEMVQMYVKCNDVKRSVYDIPGSCTNEELLGKLLTTFLESELVLPDKSILAARLRSFTLGDWMKRNSWSSKDPIRGLLKIKEHGAEDDGAGAELEEVKKELEEKEVAWKEERKTWEKMELGLLKQISKSKEREDKFRTRVVELEGEVEKLKKQQREMIEERGDTNECREMENSNLIIQDSSSSSSGALLRGSNGVYYPNPSLHKFIPHEDGGPVGMFYLGFTSAKVVDSGATCFTSNVEFTSGGKFFYQVTAEIISGENMRVGVLHGPLQESCDLEDQTYAWCYSCYMREALSSAKSGEARKVKKYGPSRTSGTFTIGVYVDFTRGSLGRIGFVADGKDLGVVFKKVVPPVRPAFSVYREGDKISIDDEFEVHDF